MERWLATIALSLRHAQSSAIQKHSVEKARIKSSHPRNSCAMPPESRVELPVIISQPSPVPVSVPSIPSTRWYWGFPKGFRKLRRDQEYELGFEQSYFRHLVFMINEKFRQDAPRFSDEASKIIYVVNWTKDNLFEACIIWQDKHSEGILNQLYSHL